MLRFTQDNLYSMNGWFRPDVGDSVLEGGIGKRLEGTERRECVSLDFVSECRSRRSGVAANVR